MTASEQLLEFNPAVIFLQDLLEIRAIECHAERTHLTHPDSVPPTLTVKRHSNEIAARVSLLVKVGQAVPQTEQGAETERANLGTPGTTGDLRYDRPF